MTQSSAALGSWSTGLEDCVCGRRPTWQVSDLCGSAGDAAVPPGSLASGTRPTLRLSGESAMARWASIFEARFLPLRQVQTVPTGGS